MCGLNFLIACNCWVQSAIFHYRDTRITERLDYFSACLYIFSALGMALRRNVDPAVRRVTRTHAVITVALIALYLQHIYYMAYVDFDYGYHVKFNAVIAAMTHALFVRYIYRLKRAKTPRAALIRAYSEFLVGSLLTTLMVTIDFPPIFDLVDMHALWHLSTIPLTLQWYRILALEEKAGGARAGAGRTRRHK